ncbi:MAG: HlyD family secretion protein, partial [Nostoc sp.]
VNKESRLFRKPVGQSRIILATSLTLAVGLITFYSLAPFWSKPKVVTQANPPKAATPAKLAVTALGRLEPEGEVTTLTAPTSNNGVRVDRLLVKEGDT